LGDIDLSPNGTLSKSGVIWFRNNKYALFDGHFDADELEAIAWVMRNEK
jgi:hypothetical protein